jgi:hypothetical protein
MFLDILCEKFHALLQVLEGPLMRDQHRIE